MREVYTVRDVAQQLHLTTETVRDYLQELTFESCP